MKQKTFKPPKSIKRLFPQVERVVHSPKSVIVDVLPRDCKEGKKLQTSECALAKATKRQFHADGVAIRLTDSFIIKGKTAIRFSTPESVKRELVSFDRHQDFAPGTYRLSHALSAWTKPGKKHSPGRGTRGVRPTKTIHQTVRVRTVSDESKGEK